MGKPQKKGTYEHVCMVIFAQGKWTERDRKVIRQPLLQKHKTHTDEPYPFHLKLTYHEDRPSYSDCKICGPIYDMFQEMIGPNDNLYYHNHHYIIPEDDKEGLKELPTLFLENPKVKKIYFLYLDSFGEFNRNDINKWSLKELREQITSNQCNTLGFQKIIEENNFKSRILYEITKY